MLKLQFWDSDYYYYGMPLRYVWIKFAFINTQFWIVWVFIWYCSYVSERRVCLIYDYSFKDDIIFKSLRTKDLKIPKDQKVFSFEFESIGITKRAMAEVDSPDRSDMF